jgi:hypothetical protein
MSSPLKASAARLAEKIEYTYPEGDVPAVDRRVTQIFRSDATKYAAGSQSKVSLFSNDMVIDLENSYFRAYIGFEISGDASTVANGQLTYETVRPILENGIEDLIGSVRIESYGKTELENLRNYNHWANFQHKMMGSPDADTATNRFSLRGDCLNSSEARAIVSNKIGENGGDIQGIPVIFKLNASGIMGNSRYLPLRLLSQLDITIQWDEAKNAIHQELVYSTTDSNYNDQIDCALDGNANTIIAGKTPITAPLAATYATHPTIRQGVCLATGRVHPSQLTVSSGAANIKIGYTISNLEFVADSVKLSPPFESALLATLESANGLPFWFNTVYTQMDQCASQSFTQRIGKGVANASRVLTKFQNLQVFNNQTEDCFASEPFGIKSCQYRLGTSNFPRDPIVNQYHMVVEADKAVNWAASNR